MGRGFRFKGAVYRGWIIETVRGPLGCYLWVYWPGERDKGQRFTSRVVAEQWIEKQREPFEVLGGQRWQA